MKNRGENMAKENESPAWTDSSDDNKLIVHRVNAADVDEPEVSSPAPAPIQGGEDEVIRVSHIRSIEVKTNMNEVQSPRENGGRFSRRRAQNEDHDDLESVVSDCAPMDVIEKSPYEPFSNAEKGVKLFSDMKSLLAESKDDDYRSVSTKATRIFGPSNAWCLVKANALIDKSGMVYSQEWVNGNIRGNLIGKIPNDLLLLCFVSKRFVKAGELLLSGLTRDLEVYNIVKEAMKEWGLEDKFERVASCPKNFPFTSKKRDCFKCEIFVARVYSCYKAFSLKGGIDGELLAKVKKCLEIMESRLPHPNAHSNKKRKSFEKKQVEEPPVEESPPQPPAKRKRGRPPKNVKQSPPPPEPAEEMSSSITESAEEPFASSRLWRSARRSTGSNTKNGKKQSLTKLMARFEDQYKEMGEKYQAMGETLRELKSKIEDNRDATEKEIRNELLAEVQKTIMGGAK